MNNNLEDKIESLIDTIKDLSDSISTMSFDSGGALSSSNYEVRSKAEEVALKRLKMEKKMLAEKEKRWNDEAETREIDRAERNAKQGVNNKMRTHWTTRTINVIKSLVEGIKTLTNTVKPIYTHIKDTWGSVDHAASNMAKSIGLSKQSMDSLRKGTLEFSQNAHIGTRYNTSVVELMQMQVKYSKDIGRAMRLNNAEMEDFAAMKQLVGDDSAVKFAASFEKFGFGISDTAKGIGKLRNEAIKAGISFDKYSSNLLDNISLAQKYTFKNGIDGLRAMAKHSTAIKWNMQQTASFAEKVSNVEGAVTTSANLSVLGGQFANFANPITMLYESLNDMESLNDRITKMFSQFATFNKKTNQIEVSAFDRMRIRSAAQAMGIDYGQVMESVFAQGRRKVAEQQINKSNINLKEGQREFLLNSSMIDRESGRAYVNLTDENGVSRKKYLDEAFSDKDSTHLDAMRRTETEDIKAMATATMSIKDQIEGIKKEYLDKISEWIEGDTIVKIKDIIQKYGDKIVWGMLALNTGKALFSSLASIASAVWSIRSAMAVNNALKGVGGVGSTSAPVIGSPMTRGGSSFWGAGTTITSGKYAGKILKPGYSYRNGHVLDSAGRSVGRMKDVGSKYTMSKASSFLKSTGGRMVGGLGAAVLGYATTKGGDYLRDNSNGNKTKDNWGKALSISGSALSGAGMLAMFGVPGMVIGGILGGAYGIYKNVKYDKEKRYNEEETRLKEQYLKTLSARNVHLLGNYTSTELMTMTQGQKYITEELRSKMIRNGDESNIPNLKEYANGGIIDGKPHSEGGTIVRAEKGEFITSKDVTEENYELLNAINNKDEITKKKLLSIRAISEDDLKVHTKIVPTQPMGEQLKVAPVNMGDFSLGNGRVDFSPLKMDMGGIIKLELNGSTKNIESKEILNNPEFVRRIRDIATQQTNEIANRNFSRRYHYNKY